MTLDYCDEMMEGFASLVTSSETLIDKTFFLGSWISALTRRRDCAQEDSD